jgi:hypothetical protein
MPDWAVFLVTLAGFGLFGLASWRVLAWQERRWDRELRYERRRRDLEIDQKLERMREMRDLLQELERRQDESAATIRRSLEQELRR